MKHFIKYIAGFSLVEFVIVIVLLGLLAASSGPLLFHAFQGAVTRMQITELDGQARYALARMTKELRTMRSNNSPGFSAGANAITFSSVTGGNITYSLSGGSLMRNSQPLAKNVTALNFTYYDLDGTALTLPVDPSDIRYIKAALTLAKGNNTLSVSTTVFPRNYS